MDFSVLNIAMGLFYLIPLYYSTHGPDLIVAVVCIASMLKLVPCSKSYRNVVDLLLVISVSLLHERDRVFVMGTVIDIVVDRLLGYVPASHPRFLWTLAQVNTLTYIVR